MAQDLKLQIMLRAVDKVTRPLKGVIKTAKSLNSQLTENATELRELSGLQKSIGGYKKLQSQLGSTASSIDNTRRSLAEMGRTIAQTEKPTKRQLAQFDKAKHQLSNLRHAHQEQKLALLASADALRKSSIDVRRLSSEESKLAKRIDSVNNKMNQHGEQLDKVRRKQRLLTKAKNSYNRTLEKQAYLSVVGTAGYATGTTALQSVTDMIQPGIEFESQMSKVSALTRVNKDSQEFQSLWQQAMQLGASTSFSASEAAAGMQFLAMAGFEVNEIYAAMPGVLSLAKASGNELAATADIASNIISGFKLEATDMNRVGDVLAATITRSNVTLDMLGETMKYVAPAAQKIGTSLEEASAMAGLLGDVGIQASMAGTVLRSLHTRLAAPPKAAKDALRQLSVQTMDTAGKMRPLPEILADIAKKTENLSNAKQLELFIDIAGQEAGTGFAELIERSGSGRIEEFANLLKQSGGEVARISAQMSDNMAGDIKAMESAWSALQITLSTSNSAPVRELVQSVTGVINRITEWTNQNPVLAAQIVKFVAIAGALILGFGGLAITVASIVGPFAVMKYALSTVGIKSLGLLSGIKSLGTGLLSVAKTAIPFLGKAFVWLGRLFLMNYRADY
ncbi:phage tail tape measure protein [Veronia nyctiphanis]|uniref:Phage tail tape measure protein n=1 Tax=Veronia nyctiphanis TaxID=1278244 RepID=A0A4Q0YND4_9GAMM|nr:phage tail tape measure protein [Veronia nyctiphanis]RXJ70661.1 phage tail tape measure protein [Veronia nyctiphanis]